MRNAFVVLLAVLFFAPYPAHAYLDPGTGSMIVQMIIAGIAGSLVAIKVYWIKIKNFFAGVKSKQTDEPGAE
jgi:hypothetical protein